MLKHCHLIFTGDVQGVGFRYITKSIANRCNVKGWVRNLSDGSVELDVEGDIQDIDGFLLDVKQEFHTNIKNIQQQEIIDPAGYNDFVIRF